MCFQIHNFISGHLLLSTIILKKLIIFIILCKTRNGKKYICTVYCNFKNLFTVTDKGCKTETIYIKLNIYFQRLYIHWPFKTISIDCVTATSPAVTQATIFTVGIYHFIYWNNLRLRCLPDTKITLFQFNLIYEFSFLKR